MRTITIKISPDGTEVTSDAQGFKGKSCHDFMQKIINALKATVLEDRKKPEYYATEKSGQKITGR
jgi:hypothetical protein